MAADLGIKNISFEVQDLMHADYREAFDFVDCAGVVNHVENPARAMRVIRQSLKANGAAAFFVYNAHHRWLSDAWQKALAVLSSGSNSLDVRFDIARRLHKAIRKSKTLISIQGPLDFVDQEADLSAVADTLCHPNEVSFSIDQVHELITAGGFKFAGWRDPQGWQISNYLAQPFDLAGRELTERQSSQLVWALTREDSPLFDFYVVRDDFQGGRPFTPRQLLRRRIRAYRGATYYTIREGRLHSQWYCDSLRPAGRAFEVMLNEDSREKSQQWRKLTRSQADLLRRAQEGISVQRLIREAAGLERAEATRLIADWLDPRVGVLA